MPLNLMVQNNDLWNIQTKNFFLKLLLDVRLLCDKLSCPDFRACFIILSWTPSFISSFAPKPAWGFKGRLPLDAILSS